MYLIATFHQAIFLIVRDADLPDRISIPVVRLYVCKSLLPAYFLLKIPKILQDYR